MQKRKEGSGDLSKEEPNMKVEIEELLKKDTETVEILNRIYGGGNWKTLDTKEKRTAWRFGYEHPEIPSGKFSNSDTPQERFHSIRLLHPQQLTDMDAFYVCLGQCVRKK